MMSQIDELIEKAKKIPVDSVQKEAQRRSFAFGNAKIENDRVTRDMVDRAAETKAR
jgi:hypothetical protein